MTYQTYNANNYVPGDDKSGRRYDGVLEDNHWQDVSEITSPRASNYPILTGYGSRVLPIIIITRSALIKTIEEIISKIEGIKMVVTHKTTITIIHRTYQSMIRDTLSAQGAAQDLVVVRVVHDGIDLLRENASVVTWARTKKISQPRWSGLSLEGF